MVCETKNVKSHINSHQQNSLQDFTFHIPCEATEESCLMRNDWLHWSFSPQLGPEDLRLKFLSDPTVLHTFGPVTVSHICFSILAARSVWLQTSVTNESAVYLHTGSTSNSSTSPLWTSKSRRSHENHETKSRPQSSRCWSHFFWRPNLKVSTNDTSWKKQMQWFHKSDEKSFDFVSDPLSYTKAFASVSLLKSNTSNTSHTSDPLWSAALLYGFDNFCDWNFLHLRSISASWPSTRPTTANDLLWYVPGMLNSNGTRSLDTKWRNFMKQVQQVHMKHFLHFSTSLFFVFFVFLVLLVLHLGW